MSETAEITLEMRLEYVRKVAEIILHDILFELRGYWGISTSGIFNEYMKIVKLSYQLLDGLVDFYDYLNEIEEILRNVIMSYNLIEDRERLARILRIVRLIQRARNAVYETINVEYDRIEREKTRAREKELEELFGRFDP